MTGTSGASGRVVEASRLAIGLRHVEVLERKDPVGRATAHHKQKAAFGYTLRELETAFRAGNNAGKTTAGALLFTALAQGRRRVCGLDLPRLRQPTTWWVLSREYKQQAHSVQPAYERWIGDWPHQVAWMNRAKGWIEQINVRWEGCGSDDPSDWSKLVFVSQHQQGETGSMGRGVKIDGWHADEPGIESVVRELRKARIAGRPFFRQHTFTPLARSEWEYLRKDFSGTLDNPVGNRVEIVASLYDNAIQNGGYLTPDEIADYIASFKNDPYMDANGLSARIFGDYIDLSGLNPFRAQISQIRRMEELCREPERELLTIVAEEPTESGMQPVGLTVEVEIFEPERRGAKYYVPGDPSLGVDDPEHDPCGVHVYAYPDERGPMRLVARYNGYVGAYGTGSIMAHLGERYGDALVDPDVTGGYGGPTLSALAAYRSHGHPNGYRNVNHDALPAKHGEYRTTLGFTMNPTNKAEMIEQIRNALRMGVVLIPSAAVLECLKNAVMDPVGRLVKPSGVKYEDLVLLGRALKVVHPHIPKAEIRNPAILAERKFEKLTGMRLRTQPRNRPKPRWR